MFKTQDKVTIPSLENQQGVVLTVDEDREPWERVEVRTDLGVLYFSESMLNRIR